MKRTIEIEKTYRTTAQKAIKRFFKAYEELYYWEETFEYMLANNLNHFSDEIMADCTKNKDWSYSLWLYPEEDTTYICVIERV